MRSTVLYGVAVEMPDVLQFEHGPISSPGSATSNRIVVSAVELPSRLPSELQCFHTWHDNQGRPWLAASRQRDGWFHLRFLETTFELSPEGAGIKLDLSQGSLQTIRHYLFNQVLPMAMSLQGMHSLHASSVALSGQAVAFVGNGGFGKSTLAARFVAAGYGLVSDDVVPLQASSECAWTSSGPAELGLWPQARRLLNLSDTNPEKVRVQLDRGQHSVGQFPLRELYFLSPKASYTGVRMERMHPTEVLIELCRAAHRLDIESRRLILQQYEFLGSIALLLPGFRLHYQADIPNADQILHNLLETNPLVHNSTEGDSLISQNH